MTDFAKLAEPFPPEKIHWRAQTVTKDGTKALALAYLNARDIQDRLDEVCGIDGWQSEHFDCGAGKLGCRIGIYSPDLQLWVWKSDGAGDTQVEAEKGAFSGALKRAGVQWGIGRYLYDLGNTWVPCESYEQGGKKKFKRFTADPWKHVQQAPVVDTETRGQGFARVVRDKLQRCNDVAAINTVVETNGEGLRKLAETDPDTYQMLDKDIQARRTYCANKPLEATE